ncbi:hypothetical protein [Burkholderia gladioli]|uniref:hypothetical protein n=1 Tax=Burkholderia gladioli TaxID=28095 RepID=UPI001640ABDF|nr:hypothetical protein [Burkholderia gladioli]
MLAVTLDQRIDWFRVLSDLTRDGSLYRLADATGIPRSSLNAYKNGVEPTHAVGMCILAHWSNKTGRPGSDAPMTLRAPSHVVRHAI